MAHEFCDQMADAVADALSDGRRASPALTLIEWTEILFKRMISRHFRHNNFLALNDYLEHWLDRRVLLQVNDVLRALLPKAARRGLFPRSFDLVPF